jgi:hypothetical protein
MEEEQKVVPVAESTVPEQTQEPVSQPDESTLPTSEPDETPEQEASKPTEVPDHKPRGQRRIEQLNAKVRELSKPQTQPDPYQQLFPNEPLIRPEEYETGVDPQMLEQRIGQRLESQKRQAMQEFDSRMQYREAANSHLSDMEQVAQKVADDPELEELVHDQYRRENYLIDPLTGKEFFVPRVKMSDILKKQMNVIEKRVARLSANQNIELGRQHQQMALPPSGKGESSPNYEDDVAIEHAKATGNWRDVLKRRLFTE